MTTTTMIDTTGVTSEQIAKCHRIDSAQGAYYRVESESTSAEYEVRYSREHGYTCSCPAGQHGFQHCKSGQYCKHVRWSIAATAEYKAAMALGARINHFLFCGLSEEQAIAAAKSTGLINGHKPTVEETARIYGAPTKRAHGPRRSYVPSFALMR